MTIIARIRQLALFLIACTILLYPVSSLSQKMEFKAAEPKKSSQAPGKKLYGTDQAIIQMYRSKMEIRADGSIDVADEISLSVTSAGLESFQYDIVLNRFWIPWEKRMADIDVKRVTFNGQMVTPSKIPIEDGIRFSLKNYALKYPGNHIINVYYTIHNLIASDENSHQLFWDPIQAHWPYQINYAEVEVALPEGGQFGDASAIVGTVNSNRPAFPATSLPGETMLLKSGRPLYKREGMFVSANWTGGISDQDSFFMAQARGLLQTIERELIYATQYYAVIPLCFILYLVLLYGYRRLIAHQVGLLKPGFRPRPPDGLGPAGALFFLGGGQNDERGLYHSILSIAASGFLSIEEDTPGKYILQRTWLDTESLDLSPSERDLTKTVFSRKRTSLRVDQSQYGAFSNARMILRKSLSKELERHFWKKNVAKLAIVILPFLLLQSPLFVLSPSTGYALFFFVMSGAILTTLSLNLACMDPDYVLAKRWPDRSAFVRMLFEMRGGMTMALTLSLFIIISLFINHVPITLFQLAYWLVTLAALHSLKSEDYLGALTRKDIQDYYRWLKSASIEIDLPIEEEYRPEALYQKHFAYTVAFRIEKAWSNRFEALFIALNEQGISCRPKFHGGQHGALDIQAFLHSMTSSFPDAIERALQVTQSKVKLSPFPDNMGERDDEDDAI